MFVKWKNGNNDFPNHNDLIFLQTNDGDYRFAVYKNYLDENLGLMKLYVLMPDYTPGVEKYLENDNCNYYKEEITLHPHQVLFWIHFKDIQPERSKREDS